jgi:hypothetical protein
MFNITSSHSLPIFDSTVLEIFTSIQFLRNVTKQMDPILREWNPSNIITVPSSYIILRSFVVDTHVLKCRNFHSVRGKASKQTSFPIQRVLNDEE